MRTILLVTLATVVACQETTEEAVNGDQTNSEGSLEEGTQQSDDNTQNVQVRDDFAGGLDSHAADSFFFGQISDDETGTEDEPGEGWGAAPMVEGRYLATIEMVYENTCGPVSEGQSFHSTLEVSEDGETLLGSGLLESNGDELRLNRLRERTVDGTVDCIQSEVIDSVGTMFNSEEMEIEIHTSVYMTGSDCPVVDPCNDSYMAYFELTQDE